MPKKEKTEEEKAILKAKRAASLAKARAAKKQKQLDQQKSEQTQSELKKVQEHTAEVEKIVVVPQDAPRPTRVQKRQYKI